MRSVKHLSSLLLLCTTALIAVQGAGCMRFFGIDTSPSPDKLFWEMSKELQGTVKLTAAQPQATLTFRLTSSYQVDAFRFQRPDLTVLPFESSRTKRDPLCREATSRGYSTGSFNCPPVQHGDAVASIDYPPKSGQVTTQDGDFLSFLSIPAGTANPGLRVQAAQVEANWRGESVPFDHGLIQYVSSIYGYSGAGALTQPVGNYVSTFRVTLGSDALTADREVAWRAIANIRGVWGTKTEAPADARLTLEEIK
jgi:hypothetical protein